MESDDDDAAGNTAAAARSVLNLVQVPARALAAQRADARKGLHKPVRDKKVTFGFLTQFGCWCRAL